MGKTGRRGRESDTKQVEKQLEYDAEVHGADPVDSIEEPYLDDAGDPITEAEALDLVIARSDEEGRKIRRVVYPGDPTAGPVADEPRVNMA